MIQQYSLKNKLKILLIESHKAPVVAVQMWVKTGSADEKKKQEGISHFIEHLVFKGTRKFGVGEVAKTVEGAGGELNAYTTFDHTVFHVTLSKEQLEVGLECVSEMMGFPKFDPIEVDREREVVLEEIKRSQDNPYQVASQRLFSTLFQKHPYGIPIIGYEKNIRTVPIKTLTGYFSQRYVPTNMTLVVAGDFSKDSTKELITKYYGDFKSYPLAKVKRPTEPAQKGARLDYMMTDFKEASLNMAFRAPHIKNPDVVGLDVLATILGHGDSSRLVRRLRLEKTLVTGVGAGNYNPLDEGIFSISAQIQPENLLEIYDVIEDELKNLILYGPTQEELNRARLNIEAEELFSLETVDGLARKIGYFQTLASDTRYIETYLKRLQKLTLKDLNLLARKYFKSEKVTLSLMLNKEDSKKLNKEKFLTASKKLLKSIDTSRKLKASLHKEMKKAKGASKTIKVHLKSKNEIKEIFKTRLSNGALVILKQNPEVPIVHYKIGFLGGVRLESENTLGMTTILSNTLTSGTKKLSEQQIASEIEDCAGTLSAFGGRNSLGLTLESLKPYEDKALRVFENVLLDPTFPQEIVEREIHIQNEHIKSRADHPSSLVGKFFMEKIFAGHPYAWDLLGTPETLKKTNNKTLTELWRKTASSDNTVIVAVGDIDQKKTLNFLENLTKNIGRGQKHDQKIEMPPLSEGIKVFEKIDKEQTHIIVGYRGLSFQDEDRFTLHVLQAILAGQGGRLFVELRDKASLAYTVSPIQMQGWESGYFGVYIGCSPEKSKTAISMIHEELDKISSKTPSEEEIERAKKYLIGRNHIDLQRNGAQASSILFDELYGIDCHETFKFAEHLHAVSSKDVLYLAQRLFKAPHVESVVGPFV